MTIVETFEADLVRHLPADAEVSPDDVRSAAVFSAVMAMFGHEIRTNGCDAGQAHEFTRIYVKLRDALARLGDGAAGTMAATVLERSSALCAASLDLTVCQGNA
jgi:hypothetical protein